MKQINYYSFFLIIVSTISLTNAIGESAVLDFLEELRLRMCHPIPKFGLPALDPFQISHAEYQMNNEYVIDFKGSVTNFRLTGLSDFIINDFKITTVPLRRSTIDFTMPLTAFKSIYTAKGSLAYIVNLAGDGNAEAYVDKIRFSASWIFKTGIYLGIRSLKLTISINDININFENLIEEDRINDFFHALVNEMSIELLNDAWVWKNESVEEFAEEKINGFIGQYTLADVIKMIGSGGDGPIFGPDDPPADCKDTTIKHD
ncbi:uncharacterized protein LOC119679350 [Teleopsis dalmanni]|uniref:uncharacterized protein LOC119679350 n=1 Tax=Teleopsis dalmanni TaxID=139649 RepID=UPI0018CE2E4D|nr:uncharacterized protein LOC119679350 [Teleopsis dalmanni]